MPILFLWVRDFSEREREALFESFGGGGSANFVFMGRDFFFRKRERGFVSEFPKRGVSHFFRERSRLCPRPFRDRSS